ALPRGVRRVPALPLLLAPWALGHAAPGPAALAPEPLAQSQGGQGAPAFRPLARAVPRRGGVLQAHAPSLGQRAPLLASPCQARPMPLLPTPGLAVQSEAAAPTWTGRRLLKEYWNGAGPTERSARPVTRACVGWR